MLRKRAGLILWIIGGTVACAAPAMADAQYDAVTRTYRLDAEGVTYAFGLSPKGTLTPIYWGKRLPSDENLSAPDPGDLSSMDTAASIASQEYPAWGGGMFTEPALKVSFADGVRDLVLRYRSHRIGHNSITVEMVDIARPVQVTLHYTIDEKTGIVGRSATIRNATGLPITIDQAASAAWSLPVGADYRLHYLTGQWASEWKLQERPITSGSTVIESRRGSTGHQANPWFAIDRSTGTEEAGSVWFGALAWSGSWRINVDRNPRGDVRVVGGLNPFDFAYRLAPGEQLATPIFYGGYSSDGMGAASRLMHRFQVARILPHAPTPKLRPVLYNSWEATQFDVNEAGQIALADKAAMIGVERFVVDDGWFGQRNSDKAGLGDWVVNPTKFPRGLKPLIDHVHARGMEFGLWVEPEMVNADSDLYRAHPDWVIGMPGRPRTEARNQMVLNLARPDVRDHVLKVLDDLVRANDIQFLKWDYNRNWSEPGWPQVAPADQQRIYVEYVRNLYWILGELRKRHPKLEIESCSGGGGRVDMGILSLTDQVWPSDNTDPFDRLAIQHGFSHAYAPAVMMAWVTDSPNWANDRTTSLRYRFLSSMQGSLGVGANLNHWTAEDMMQARALIAAYKDVRPLVQRGDLYRLISPLEGSSRSATLYVAPDRRRAVLFAFLHSSIMGEPQQPVRLAGLEPDRLYRLRPLDGKPGVPEQIHSGTYWMESGVPLTMKGDFQADAYVLDGIETASPSRRN